MLNCLSHAAWALWFLGAVDQSLARSREALVLTRDLGDPFYVAKRLGRRSMRLPNLCNISAQLWPGTVRTTSNQTQRRRGAMPETAKARAIGVTHVAHA
jgi:hypothetical protein